jgi:hypothetical protein
MTDWHDWIRNWQSLKNNRNLEVKNYLVKSPQYDKWSKEVLEKELLHKVD